GWWWSAFLAVRCGGWPSPVSSPPISRSGVGARWLLLATRPYLRRRPLVSDARRFYASDGEDRRRRLVPSSGILFRFRAESVAGIENRSLHHRLFVLCQLAQLPAQAHQGQPQPPRCARDVPPTEPGAPVEYVLYRWCGLGTSSQSLHPACPSTVTFVFNETLGVGMVLYATNAVYDYAYARHVTGDEYR